MTADPFDLTRFVEAQAGVHETALTELVTGRKRTHWMWFVFPQLRGLGASAMADRYGIGSLAEARAYLAHPVLGPRLDACTRAMLAHAGASARDILGRPDDMKFRSSMTLFDRADGREGNPFRTALEAFCGGVPDERTLELLREG